MSEPILKVKGLKVHFPVSGGFLAKKQIVKAVDGVDFEIAEGETFGLVGESGCGDVYKRQDISNQQDP